MKFPKEFNSVEYVKWHNDKWPSKFGLTRNLESFRQNLMKSSVKDLEFLSKLFSYYIKVSDKEYKTQQTRGNPLSAEYMSPLADTLRNKQGQEYSLVFKSVSSIIDKLWRKNKEEHSKKEVAKRNFVTLTNLPSRITDLIRTEIMGGSLEVCKSLSLKFKDNSITDKALKSQFDRLVKTIDVESEMKMDKGYFAYHILVHFKDGLKVEVQIYSATIKKWRKLSHILYESSRLFGSDKPEFNSKESRLISLGHLFHLAECEIKTLEDELNSQEMK